LQVKTVSFCMPKNSMAYCQNHGPRPGTWCFGGGGLQPPSAPLVYATATDTPDFCPRQLVTDLLRGSRQLAGNFPHGELRGNVCNGFWALYSARLHTQELMTSLSPVHTVAEKWDCRRKRRDNGEIRRLSHFSATVSLLCDSVDRALHDVSLLRAKMTGGRRRAILPSHQLSGFPFQQLILLHILQAPVY